MASVGLQLYTIKEKAAENFLGTLYKVAEIGYEGVEFAGYFNTGAADLRRVLEETHLRPIGTHLGINGLKHEIDKHIGYCHQIGCPTVLCPGFWGYDLSREATFLEMADFFNQIGEQCRANQLGFAYHIHGYEFVQLGNRTGMDILFQNTDPSLVSFELDTYCVEKGGKDLLPFYREHRDRVSHFHLKDAKDRDTWHDVEVGTGIVDIAGLIWEAQNDNAEWFIIEQEAFQRPPMESIVVSLANVRQLLRPATN